MSELFGPLSAPDRIRAAVADAAWIRAMLDAEAALAAAEADVGLVPADAAAAIAAACAPGALDVAGLGADALASGNPVVPLVARLRAAVGAEAAAHVHRGATSQDVLDTAAMLVARDALALVGAELDGAARACAALARDHAGTPMAGRTLLQQALPVTFGLTAAGWLDGLLDARAGLARVRLDAQLGGAAGTLAALGADGPRVAERFAERLGLGAPPLPWHTARARVGELAAALGVAAGVCGKVGLDLVLLAQTEVGEVVAGRGGSSAMPHKQNPVGAVRARACAARVPPLVALLLGAMAQEHQRAAGAWHAEWEPLAQALALTGGAAAGIGEALGGLEVRPDRMRANLELTGGALLAERVVAALAPHAGHDAAVAAVRAALEARRAVPRRAPGPARRRAAPGRGRARRPARPGDVRRRRARARGARARPRRAGAAGVSALAHRVDGPADAPALVLSNSIGTDMTLWEPQLAALAARFRVVRYDTRGHGGSAVVPGDCTLTDLVADLAGLLDTLGIARASVAGVSLGGMTAMALAARRAGARRAARAVLHVGAARPAGAVARARRRGARGRHGRRRRGDGRPLVHARRRPGRRRALRGDPARDARRGLRRLLRRDPRHGPAPAARGDRRARARHLRRRGPVDAARARRRDRRRHPGGAQRRAGPRRAPGQRRTRRGGHGRHAGASRSMTDHDEGMRVRREVLGDAHVDRAIARTTDLTRDYQDFITRYAWGDIWTRPGLDRRTRSCITLTALVAGGHHEELAMHVRAALRNGLTPGEIGEVLLQCAVYCGVPAANSAFAVAQRVLAEDGVG